MVIYKYNSVIAPVFNLYIYIFKKKFKDPSVLVLTVINIFDYYKTRKIVCRLTLVVFLDLNYVLYDVDYNFQ